MNKRYWVFSFDQCYPSGGANDLVGSCYTFEDADKMGYDSDGEFYNILDIDTGQTFDGVT